MKRKTHAKNGFTLVEILTAMAVIAILLAFLIPALSSVEQAAMKVKQRAQFHGIEIALEAFSSDASNDYPPSTWDVAVYGEYSASQRLAEALIGRDGFGFHPDSTWNKTGENAAGNPLYMDHAGYTAYYSTAGNPTVEQNMAARYGPYLELENANAVKLSSLYGGLLKDLVDSYVLADMFKITKNQATGKMVGSPILYYKANRNKIHHHYSKSVDNIYNVYDATGTAAAGQSGIARQVPLGTKTGNHPLRYLTAFYTQTINPNFPGDASYNGTTGTPPRPYRSDSFILQSAGPDGLYGTADDIFNFDQEK